MRMQAEIAKRLERGDVLDHYRAEAAIAHSGISALYRAVAVNSASFPGQNDDA